MFRILFAVIILVVFSSEGLCETYSIRDRNGNKTGYIKVYSQKKATQYNKYGQRQYSYKKSSSGRVTKYDNYGRRIGTYK